MYDAIIAGAGLWGCTVARRLAEAGRRVLLLEERAEAGGNCLSRIDPETGIERHLYGAHIFHTSIDDSWAFINRFTAMTPYRHQVLTLCRGKVYFLPLGLPLINAFYGLALTPAEVPAFIAREAAGAGLSGEPRNLEEKAISLIGRPLYEAFIKGYTQKQWDTDPRNLPAFIIDRLPVRADYNTSYFNDLRQGMPECGYAELFRRIIDHPGITLRCGVDYLAARAELPAHLPVFYSGPIDRLFDYRHGPLPWRGLRFEWETLPVADFQGTAVMNYADPETPWTRIHEFKHFHPERSACHAPGKTTICREFPAAWTPGDAPFYPVNTDESRARYDLYRRDAEALPNLVVGGRLGEYRYYDMDKTIDRALHQADDFLKGTQS